MASQKGGSGFGILIGLILSIFVIIGLIWLTVTNNSAYWAEVNARKAAELQLEEAVKKEVEAKREAVAIYQLVHGSTSPVDIEKVTRDYLKVAAKRLDDALAQEALSSEQYVKDLNKDGRLAKKEYKYLLEMYADLFVELEAAIPEINRVRVDRVALQKELETAKETGRTEVARVEKELEAQRKEAGDLRAKALEDARAWDEERRRLAEAAKVVQDELAKKEEQRLIAEARLESEISALKGRISELTAKKQKSLADTEADGEIVHSDQRLGLAWINLGQKDRIRRGVPFDVFQYVKGGVKKIKGQIEVKSLEDDRAQVAILSQTDPSDPIVKGDFISSPFFDAKKTMTFVFVGAEGAKLSARSRYSMDELIRRIEEHGGKVDRNVTIETDFLVALEGAEQTEEFQKAVQFGVVIMREPELLEYIGR